MCMTANIKWTIVTVLSGLSYLNYHNSTKSKSYFHFSLTHKETEAWGVKERAFSHTGGKSMNPDRLALGTAAML